MKEFDYKPTGTCSNNIHLVLSDDDIIEEIVITKGCNGTSKGMAALAKGRKASEVEELLRGIRCNSSVTSCPDQVAKALAAMREAK